jgi:carboxymethylenebutenolidase
MVEFDAGGARTFGYLVRPSENGPHPAVVVIQEWWGLNEHIMDVAERVAREGYVALAVDLYHGAVAEEPDEARKLAMKMDHARAVADVQGAVDYLASREDVEGEGVGAMGFCMGGGLALAMALQGRGVGAVVAFYGQPLSRDEAAQIKAPVLALFGAQDASISADAVSEMESGLASAETDYATTTYPAAGHAFFNDTRDSYSAEAAAAAWQRTLDWFAQHL